MHNIM